MDKDEIIAALNAELSDMMTKIINLRVQAERARRY